MGYMGNLMVRLGINTTQFTTGLNGAATAATRFSTRLTQSFRQTQSSANATTESFNVFARAGTSGFKDVSRIAQGILVSQAFYRTVNAIQGATAALAEFSSQTEQAGVSFAIMMKDADKAERFMNTIEDFSAKTPFTFQQAADNARKLLAYGFSSANMEPIMNTLADASSASGDSETFNRVGRALGQIKTKGRLASQELLQLTEAGIPAFEILREKLQLTSDQMANIGKLKIPADVAINAILKGMQEKYGGAAAALSNTVSGMLNTIKDNALIIGSEAFGPLYYGFKNTITKIRDLTDSWRASIRRGGIGGFLREIIPADVFPKIQLLAANLRLLRQNLGLLFTALGPVIKAIGMFFLNAINFVLPFVNALGRVIAVVAQVLTSSSKGVRIFVGAILGLAVAAKIAAILLAFGAVVRSLFIVKLLAQMVIFLAQAFRILALAMISSPWIALIAVAAGALMYLGLTSKKVSGWMTNLGGTISKAFGADPSKEFAPKMQKNAEKADEFNQKLKVSKESLDKMGKAAEKAGDKAKEALMSFDEVFNLKDQDETDDPTKLDDIEDIGTPTIPPITIPDPVFPDVGAKVQEWVSTFKDTIITKLKNTLMGAGIGAAIGAVIGGLLGGPGGAVIGAKIGALAGGIVGLFWDQMSAQMKNSVKAAGVGAGIGAVIGTFVGGPVGAVIGAAIGALAGAVVGWFWDDLTKAFQNSTIAGASIGALIGGVLGTAFGGPLVGVLGASIGGAIGAFVGQFWPEIKRYFNQTTTDGALAGGVLGAALGMVFAGPLGAGIGAAIGAAIGSLIAHFWPDIKNAFQNSATISGAAIGGAIGGIVGFAIAGPIGAAVGVALGGTIGGIVGHFWEDIKKYFNESTKKGTAAGTTIGAVIGTFICPGIGTVVGAALGSAVGSIVGHFWKNIVGWWKTASAKEKASAGAGALIGGIIGTIICPGLGTVMGTLLGGAIGGTVAHFWKNIVSWWKESSNKDKASVGVGAIIGGIIGTIICPGIGTALGAALGGIIPGIVSKFWNQLKSAVSGAIDSVMGAFGGGDGKITIDVVSGAATGSKGSLSGHASGGIFNKEHIARFAEGGKTEAIIPLENPGAMRPFVDAVAMGVSASLGNIVDRMAQGTTGNSSGAAQPIMYVGTLIADDRSLKELERKMRVVALQEDQRR